MRKLLARFAHLCDEAIALGRDGDYELRRIRVVIQRAANLPHRRVDSVVGIEENSFAPDALEDFLARDQLIAPLDQQKQQVERNPFQLERTALAPKLVNVPIEFKVRESKNPRRHFTLTSGPEYRGARQSWNSVAPT